MKKALLIGINYFGTESELRGCINDVENIKTVLTKTYGYTEDHIAVLTDDPSNKVKPTRQEVIKAIQALISGAKAGDCLFFHYSGHGSYTRDRSGDESDGKDECICCLDDVLIDDELRKFLIEPLPAGVKLTGLLDCCHSGSGADLRYRYLSFNDKQSAIFKNAKYRNTRADVVFISGCADHQTSADAYEAKQFQGAMSYAFRTVLGKTGSKTSYQKLMRNMRKFLKDNGYPQLVQLTSGKQLRLSTQFNPA